MYIQSIFAFNSYRSLALATNSGCIVSFGDAIVNQLEQFLRVPEQLFNGLKSLFFRKFSDILKSLSGEKLLRKLQRPLIQLNSGMTDQNFGHRDEDNVSGLGTYHYHHGMAAHLHPGGVCPYVSSNSLINALSSYDGADFFTKGRLIDGETVLVAQANIPFDNGASMLSLEIHGSVGEFYLYKDEADANGEIIRTRDKVKDFFTKEINAVYVRDDDSDWYGEFGPFDFNVNVMELHRMISEIEAQLKPNIVYAIACTDGNDSEHLIEFPSSYMHANAQYIYKYLTRKGWSKNAICGLLGNVQQESNLNPGTWEYWDDLNHGYGIVQWTPSGDSPERFLQENHLTAKTVDAMAICKDIDKLPEKDKIKSIALAKQLMDMQLGYLLDELAHKGEWLPGEEFTEPHYQAMELENQDLKGMTLAEYKISNATVHDLALIFHASYERSDDTDPDKAPFYTRLDNRITYAQQWESFLGNR